jgi:hypothetical protein
MAFIEETLPGMSEIFNSNVIEENDHLEEKDVNEAFNRFNLREDTLHASSSDQETSDATRLSVIVNTTPQAFVQVQKSNNYLSDFDDTYWIKSFAELFPFGRGGFDEKRKIGMSLHYYVNRLLMSSRRNFAQHFSFGMVAFDVISRHRAFSRLYYRIQTTPSIATKSFSIDPEQLKTVLKYNDELKNAYSTYSRPPIPPDSISNVSALKNGIAVAEGAMWGTREEHKKAQRQALAMTLTLGQPHLMLTLCPDSSGK